MNSRWNEVMAERMHFDQRGHADGITKVISIHAPCHARTGHRFCSQEACLHAFTQRVPDEGEGEPGHIAAATYAPDNDIWVIARFLHLEHSFFTDNSLMHQDMVQHTTKRILDSTSALCRNFYRLADSNTQATWILRVLRQDAASGIGQVRGTGMNGRPIRLHEITPVRFLLITDLHHEDFNIDAKESTCHCQG